MWTWLGLTNRVGKAIIFCKSAVREASRMQKAMTGRVWTVRKRREGAAGVSSREAVSEGHPGAAPPKRPA